MILLRGALGVTYSMEKQGMTVLKVGIIMMKSMVVMVTTASWGKVVMIIFEEIKGTIVFRAMKVMTIWQEELVMIS